MFEEEISESDQRLHNRGARGMAEKLNKSHTTHNINKWTI